MTNTPYIPLSRLRLLHWQAKASYMAFGGISVSNTFRGYVEDEVQRRAIEALRARVEVLEAELAEARKWIPSTDYSSGSITLRDGRLFVEVRDWDWPDDYDWDTDNLAMTGATE